MANAVTPGQNWPCVLGTLRSSQVTRGGRDWIQLALNIHMSLPPTITPVCFYFPLNWLPWNTVLGWENIGGSICTPPSPKLCLCIEWWTVTRKRPYVAQSVLDCFVMLCAVENWNFLYRTNKQMEGKNAWTKGEGLRLFTHPISVLLF